MLENSPVERNRTELQKRGGCFRLGAKKDEREDNEEEEEASAHKHLHMTAMEERGIAKERVEWNGGENKKRKIGEFPSKQTSTRQQHLSALARRKDAPSLHNV